MENSRVRIGIFLFKYRSFAPLPLILLIIVAFRPGHSFSWIPAVPGLLLVLSGQYIRFWAVGFAAPGTSGRESFFKAEQLNTTGLYSVVRNPLYIGNLLIYSGLLITYGNLWAFLIGIAFLIGEYSLIVSAEEHFLKEQYGALYLNYCQKVHRWLPDFSKYALPSAKFDLVKVVFKETDSVFNALLIYIFILLYREYSSRGHVPNRVAYGIIGALLIASYAAVKVIKKRSANFQA